jgi:formylglycine-generating enzyme required for sulfatase activity
MSFRAALDEGYRTGRGFSQRMPTLRPAWRDDCVERVQMRAWIMCSAKSSDAVLGLSEGQGSWLGGANRALRQVLLFGGLALFALLDTSSGQGLSGVTSVQVYAGITVTGSVGRVYAIQTTTDLSRPESWVNLAIITLPNSPYLFFDTQNPATSARFYRAVRQSVTTNMIYIASGTFTMGSPTSEVDRWPDETQHTVVLTHGFYICKYLVRQGDYLAVIGVNPSHFTGTNYPQCTLNCPVEMVSWNDATNYCARFTQQEAAAGRLAPGWEYRLPTESEWEYACRAGTTTRFSYGDDPGYINLTSYAYYFDNSFVETHPVGQKMPNPWGLFDMQGNVDEWCLDWYGSYPSGTVTDPQGHATGQDRIVRGGHYFSAGSYCRSAQRYHYSPATANDKIGFRIVLAPIQ